MTTNEKYKIINIRRYIDNNNLELGEDALIQILSEFSCPINPDVERIKKKSSIDFTKKINLLHISYSQFLTENCSVTLLSH